MGLVGTISSGQADVALVPDQTFADWINNTTSATRAALSATYARKHWVDVKEATYGAVGDGVADDTAAFVAAKAAGKSIHVPPGTYIINGLTLDVADQSWLLSPGTTIKAKTGGSQTVLTITAANVSVIGMGSRVIIDGNSVGTSAGWTAWINGPANATIKGVVFVNCAGGGVIVEGDRPTVRECTFTNPAGPSVFVRPPTSAADINSPRVQDNYITATANTYGIQVQNNGAARSLRAKVTGNEVTLPAVGAAGIGIELFGASPRSVVSGNTAVGGNMGISVSSSDGCTVAGNTVEGAASWGIEVAASSRCTVAGNTVNGNAVTTTCIAINSTGGKGNVLTGNTVYNYAAGGKGIHVAGTSVTTTTVTGNSVSGEQPIYIANGSDFVVTGNVVDGLSLANTGVVLDTCNNGVVTGNGFKDCTTSGVYLLGAAPARVLVGPNMLNGTPADLTGTLGTASRLIRGSIAPAGVLAITVTASPFTYTNTDQSAQAVYVSGGTVSAIAKNAVTVFAATDQTVWLEPGEAVTVTYSVAPTMTKDRK